MFPPAIETGTLALTAFWLLAATPKAPWFVAAFWAPICAPPGPPSASAEGTTQRAMSATATLSSFNFTAFLLHFSSLRNCAPFADRGARLKAGEGRSARVPGSSDGKPRFPEGRDRKGPRQESQDEESSAGRRARRAAASQAGPGRPPVRRSSCPAAAEEAAAGAAAAQLPPAVVAGFARARGARAWPSPWVSSTLRSAATLLCGTTVEIPAPGRTSERDAARAIEPCARSARPEFAAPRSCPETSDPE